jgi:hypothetical protein
MKSFKKHLAEAIANPSICDLLKLPTAKAFIERLEISKDLKAYWNALNLWFYQSGDTKRFMGKIVEMGMCPNKAKWASWSGKGYRGLTKPKKWAKKLQYTGETVVKGEYLYLVANGIYQSRYTAQSWTNDFEVAVSFANSDRDIPVVIEIELTRENTLFSPESSVAFSGFGESEIIRVGNKPTKVKVYVNIGFMIRFFCYRILSNGGTKPEQTSWWTKQFEGLFSQLGDEKFVKDLMANPKIKAIIKREAKVSI